MKKKKLYTPETVRKQLKNMRVNYYEVKSYRKPWSDAENEELKDLFYNGYDLSRIALHLGRTEKAIFKQIDNLGLYKKVYNTSDKQKKGCKCPKCQLNDTDYCVRGCSYAG